MNVYMKINKTIFYTPLTVNRRLSYMGDKNGGLNKVK